MLSVGRLRRLQEDGLISVRALDDLIILNYTHQCERLRKWDNATMQCRGLILRVDKPWPDSTDTVEIVARPWKKFFNVGEDGMFPSGKVAYVTDKLDGSLGVGYHHDGRYKIATRGSFNSDQAIFATNFLAERLQNIPENITLIFEIIYPENRVVVDYKGMKDVILIGVVDRYTGKDWGYDKIKTWANFLDISCVPLAPDIFSADQAIDKSKQLDYNFEGWVLRYDDGSRWKVKGLAYRQMHQIMTNVTPKRVLEAMIDNTVQHLSAEIPGDFSWDVQQWIIDYNTRLWKERNRLYQLFEGAPVNGDRKLFAEWVLSGHKADAGMLFRIYDGKEIDSEILRSFL